jgi:hypothetical protein
MAHKSMPRPGDPIQLGEFFLEDRRFPAVYFLYNREKVVYVGQSRTLKWRIETHLSEGIKRFDAVAFIPCTIDRLLSIETHYIRKLLPQYNHCGVASSARQMRAHHHDEVEARAAKFSIRKRIDECAERVAMQAYFKRSGDGIALAVHAKGEKTIEIPLTLVPMPDA